MTSGPEILGEKEGCPYGITREYGKPVVIIGDEPFWYLSPDHMREIADEVEAVYEEENHG